MLQDHEIVRAVSRIRQRAERQEKDDQLVAAYVDSGILPQLTNENHQILYGRRGTGKTHVLRVLGDKMEHEGICVAYIDCRTLGSSSQFTDSSSPIRRRCLALFRDILAPVYNRLLEEIIERQPAGGPKALEAADAFLKAIVEPVHIYETKEVEYTEDRETSERSTFSASAELVRPAFRAGGEISVDEKGGERLTQRISVTTEDKVLFPSINHFLSECLVLVDKKIFILLDEWSTLPHDLQPYLAEFLKRGVLPVQRATVKIAALEQRSSFNLRDGGNHIGFELGADIAITQDLDDTYVFDRNQTGISRFYADVLFRHLLLEVPKDYLYATYKIREPEEFISQAFTGQGTFTELARAAEGVIRDLINVFTMAFFHAQKRARGTIDKQAVVEAARQWFEQDKAQHLDQSMQNVLRKIVDEVIGSKRARSFLLPRDLEKHPMILKLFDARVIHHLQRGYADKDNPGVRYNIYTLDYGTYVDLIGTSKAPQIEFEGFVTEVTDPGIVVPFDDKRSIRRIVLHEDMLR
jgi:hypothetical protein